MKKEKMLRAIAIAMVPAILAPSCSGYFFIDDISEINRRNSNPKGKAAVELILSEEEKKLLNFINQLVSDIVSTPLIARQFAESPETFAKIYGVEELQIDFEDPLWKLILALGDEDIHRAIKLGDISLFLSLCDERGLIAGLQDADLSRFHNILTQNPDLPQTRGSLVVVLAAGVAVVAGAIAGAIAVAAGAAAYYLAVISVEVFWTGNASIKMDTRVYQIWALKGDNEKTYVMLSEYQNKIVDNIIEALQEHFSKEMQNVNIHELKQAIALNLN